MAFKAIDPGLIPGGDQFFKPCIFLAVGLEGKAIIFSNAPILFNSSRIYIHSSKKVMQHKFDLVYFFYHGFVFIKFDITRKPVYVPFDYTLFVTVVSLRCMQGS